MKVDMLCYSAAESVRLPDSRGEEQRAVHQRAVVVVADEVVLRRGVVAHLGFVGDLDGHRVVGVVEVDDVDVKDEDGRGRDDVTWKDHRRRY